MAIRDRFGVLRGRDRAGYVGNRRRRPSELLCFIGSWFFTTAGWMQLVLARPALGVGCYSAATQFGPWCVRHRIRCHRDAVLANARTFIGALCFLAALLVLPPTAHRNPERGG